MTVRIACLLLAGLLLGCSPSTDTALESVRGQYLLNAEPSDAAGVLDVREGFSETEQSVVVVGQIGGVDDPWTHGAASFVVADPSHLAMAALAGDCEADCDCVFCRKKSEHDTTPLALVKFTDKQGEVVPIDARKLFEISEQQTVVVRGKATIDALGVMVIAADGMYIRR